MSVWSQYCIKPTAGTRLVTELQLLDLPTAICTFYIDTTEPHTPGKWVCLYLFLLLVLLWLQWLLWHLAR